jgi:hypothetical protein
MSVLGYRSNRTVDLGSSRPQAFLEYIRAHDADDRFNEGRALFADWKSADLLFQLTSQELSSQRSLLNDTDVNADLMQSYVFFAIELTGGDYARG